MSEINSDYVSLKNTTATISEHEESIEPDMEDISDLVRDPSEKEEIQKVEEILNEYGLNKPKKFIIKAKLSHG